jgi:hypothetical protein
LVTTFLFLALVLGAAASGFYLYKDSRFGRFDRFNVVLATSPVALLSVDTAKASAVLVKFPDDLYIPELAFGYGPYQAAKIYAVGSLDKRGGETLSVTLSDYLGVGVDGYIYSPTSLSGDIKNFFLAPQNIFTADSNLNILDRLRLSATVFLMRFDKIKTVDLVEFTSPLVLADGGTARSLDKESLDGRLADFFAENKIQGENYRVEVVNSTNVAGLGNRAGRLLSNMGANVVSVGTSSPMLPTCQILTTAQAKNSATVKRIAFLFSCQVTLKSDGGRADVVVTIGEDYAKKLGR